MRRSSALPAQPSWIHRLPEISDRLREVEVPFLDRRLIEKLFGIRPRRAQLLMRSFAGYRAGNSRVIDRTALLARLEELERGEEVAYERRRRVKVVEALEQAHEELAGRRVQIRVDPEVFRRQIAELPEGIRLTRGELRIRFDGPQELLSRLFELSQAILNDYQRFEEMVRPDPATASTARE